MTTHEPVDPTPPPGPEDALRHALAAEAGGVEPVASADALDAVRRRARSRRSAKVGALGGLAAAVLVVAGVAIAAQGRTTPDQMLASGGSTPGADVASTLAQPASTTTTAGGPGQVDPATTIHTCLPGIPAGTPGSCDGTGSGTTTTVPPTSSSFPGPTLPHTIPTGPGWPGDGSTTTTYPGQFPETTVPVTTIPGPDQTTSPPVTTQPGGDCGGWNEYSGWPTTVMYRPDPCLTDAFEAGIPATFHLQAADGQYPSRLIIDFTVTGVRTVEVRVDRSRAAAEPRVTTTYVCHQLRATEPGDLGIFVYDDCSPIG